MRFFTYGRKSVYRDNSDSIDNQFRMCREYCEMRFPGEIDSWQQFSDEDFTGANTNRPGFLSMMEMIRAEMCDVLVVYQLDRFSRDVRDFSQAYKEMQDHGVRFICLDLNVDTSTPIGEAMMFVSSAFGQMERKNIAMRITDNMLGLAKKGYWMGGVAPMGYTVKRMDIDGKKHSSIIESPKDAEYLNWLFDRFLATKKSCSGLAGDLKAEGCKTASGREYTEERVYKLLRSPFCCEATKDVYDYYKSLGCKMESPRELWNGTHGVMVYGRTVQKGKTARHAPASEWTVCIGYHKPIMSAEKWLAVQTAINGNKKIHKKKHPAQLLSGSLYCSCGSKMAVHHQPRRSGGMYAAYYCQRRKETGVEACDRHNISCEVLNDKVLDIFGKIAADPKLIKRYMEKNATKKDALSPRKINKQINDLKENIKKLTESIVIAESSAATKYIIAEIEKLDTELKDLEQKKIQIDLEAIKARDAERASVDKVAEITRMMSNLDGFTMEEKNEIVRSVVKEMTWDGTELFIML